MNSHVEIIDTCTACLLQRSDAPPAGESHCQEYEQVICVRPAYEGGISNGTYCEAKTRLKERSMRLTFL